MTNTPTTWGVAMAGQGSPFTVLTPRCQYIVQALHRGQALSDLKSGDGTPIATEIRPLIATNLLRPHGDTYLPNFLVADCAETLGCIEHAQTLGDQFAASLGRDWPSIETAFHHLQPGRTADLAAHALFLVGGRLLDAVMLVVLTRDGTLLPVAPLRPDLDGNGDRYFLFMIERPADYPALYYGQNAVFLPWEDWYLLTFGAYSIDGAPNAARKALEARARERSESADSIQTLARQLKLPSYEDADIVRWNQTAFACAGKLLAIYLEHKDSLDALYRSLKASAYLHDGFGEFFCWYHHLVYTAAIDRLIDRSFIQMPADRFVAALWQGSPIGEHAAS